MADKDATAESPLVARLRADLQTAQRARDQVRMDTLRMALDAIHYAEVARTDPESKQYRQPLTQEDQLAILEQQIKRRREAIELYRKGGRADLVAREEREAEILQAYMPGQLTDAELRQLVNELIAEHGKDFRKVMPLAARATKGRADGRHVQEIVRELIG
jgi:uncharacterized protein YqeY